MTAMDVDGQGTLLIHSPIRLTEPLMRDLANKGRVAYVVAPNKWHHLYLADFKNKYPQAEFFGAPGLEKKRPDFTFDRIITDESNFPWNPHIQHMKVQGSRQFNEVAFFHRRSRSLVLTDTALHICENSPFLTRLAFRLIGTYKKFGLSPLEFKIFVDDAAAFLGSMKTISEWDFDRVIVSHGQILESGGKAEFKKAYRL